MLTGRVLPNGLRRVRGRLSCLAGGHPICPRRGSATRYLIPRDTFEKSLPLLLSNTHKYKYKDKMDRISETSPSWAVLGMPAASRISLRDKVSIRTGAYLIGDHICRWDGQKTTATTTKTTTNQLNTSFRYEEG